jgi:hypothetical protein
MATGTLPPEYAQIVRGGLRYRHGDNFSTPEAQNDLRMVQRFKQNPQDPEALQFINQLTEQAEWGNPQTGGHMAAQGTLGGFALAPFLTKALSFGKLAPHPAVKGASHLAGLALGGYGAYNLADAQTRKEYELPDTDFQNFLGLLDLGFAPFDAAALKKHGLGSFFKGRPTEAPNPNAIDPDDLADTSQKNFGLVEEGAPDAKGAKSKTGTTVTRRTQGDDDNVVARGGRRIPDARRVVQPPGYGWGPQRRSTKPRKKRWKKMGTPQPGKLPWDVESDAANKSIWSGFTSGVKRKEPPLSQAEQALKDEVSGEAKGIGETFYSGEKQTFKAKGAATEQPDTPETLEKLRGIQADESVKVEELVEKGLTPQHVKGHVPEIQVELDAAWRRYQDDVTRAQAKKKEPKAAKDPADGIEITPAAEQEEAARITADAVKRYQDEVTDIIQKWRTASPEEKIRMSRAHLRETDAAYQTEARARAERQLEGVEPIPGVEVRRPVDPLPHAPKEGASRRQRPGSYETQGGQTRSTGPQAGRDHQGATAVKRRKKFQEAEEPRQLPLTGLPLEMPPTRPKGGAPKPEYEFDPTAEPSSGRTAGRKGPDPEDFEIQGVRDASRGGRAGRIHDYSDGELNQILERLRARAEQTRSAGQAADTEILEETIYQIERALRLRDLGMSKRVL